MRSTSPFSNSWLMSFTFLAGTPAKMLPAGTWVPSSTTAPAAIMQLAPMFTLSMTIAPIPISTAMHQCIVTDGYIIADNRFCLLVGAVDTCTILNVYFVAYPDTVHIAAHYSVEPYTAIFAHYYIAHYCCIGRYKTGFGYLGGNPFYGKNNWWHKPLSPKGGLIF